MSRAGCFENYDANSTRRTICKPAMQVICFVSWSAAMQKCLNCKWAENVIWVMRVLHNLKSGDWLLPFQQRLWWRRQQNRRTTKSFSRRTPTCHCHPSPHFPPVPSFAFGRTLLGYVTSWSWLMRLLPGDERLQSSRVDLEVSDARLRCTVGAEAIKMPSNLRLQWILWTWVFNMS